MKKFLPKTANNPKGFTLIELLIVITIIAVLSAIGYAVYSGLNTQSRSRNSVRRADLDAISKALEVNKTVTSYLVLDATQFSNAAIPTKDPLGNVYCGNLTASTQPTADITAVSSTACTPNTTYSPISSTIPPAGTSWKICTWLEDEDGAGTASVAKAFCKLSTQ